MNLTKNFTLAEFNFRDYQLDDTLIDLAKKLAENLQVIRDFVGKPVRVTSWYRPLAVNSMVGGSITSQHLHGEAVDFVVNGLDANGLDDLFNAIVSGKLKLPHACTQIIRETKGEANWIHMGIKTPRWIESQKQVIASDANSMAKSKASKRLTHCECLRTPDAVHFELVKYLPYSEFA